MSILGIDNRTENWKTAKTFAPIITNKKQVLITNKIIENVTGNLTNLNPEDVKIELFFVGFRDYIYSTKKSNDEIQNEVTKIYDDVFPNLRQDIDKKIVLSKKR